jgi:uncharacterized membrane protein YoaK (UPF0700 family)
VASNAGIETQRTSRAFTSRAGLRLSEPRVRDLLLVALTVATGAVDAVSWLVLDKVFSAFMTGNFVFLGLRIGGAGGPSVPRLLVAVAGYGA